MTAAQKKNAARFKAVQAEAKKLKAKNKNLKHVDAVKQAWAILYAKNKKIGYQPKRYADAKGITKVMKRQPKKLFPFSYDENLTLAAAKYYNDKINNDQLLKQEYKAIRGVKKPTEKAILKKVHAAKTTSKNLFNKLDKLDEAQHKHMGALDKNILQKYQDILNNIKALELALIKNKETLKKAPYKTDFWKKYIKEKNTKIKKYIAELKKHKTELKKLL